MQSTIRLHKSDGRAAPVPPGRTAKEAETKPQSLRHKPSLDPSYEPLREINSDASAERLHAFQLKQENIEVIQNRVARRIGSEGWLILGAMTQQQLARITRLERLGRLDDAELSEAVGAARLHLLER
jgi:hypothetical protein